MTREEKNRKLAEWLEPEPTTLPDPKCWTQRLVDLKYGIMGEWQPRNFFTDESANALLRSRLAREAKVLRIIITQSGYTTIIAGSETAPDAAYEHSDYMTAIGETCIKWIEKPKEPSE